MLNVGDIAVVGFQADNPDAFAFVALVDIPTGTEVLFTDNGVRLNGEFRANEGILKWTAPEAIPAGTVIPFLSEDPSPSFTVEDSGFNLSSSGDQVIAYQLDDEGNPKFIFAAQSNSTQFQTGSDDAQQSDLPPGLTVGTTAIAAGAGAGAESEFDNIAYSGTTSGTRAQLLASIGDAANWTGSNARDGVDLPTAFNVTSGEEPPLEEGVFTLELLHAADQEGGTPAIVDAPNFSAVLNALKAQDLGDDGEVDNTLVLSSGDAIIPGVFFDASEAVFGSAGIADILIQNELGFEAIALGNHEFDFGTADLAALIDGSASGVDQDGNDYEGADFAYLSTNLDFSTNEDLAPLAVAGGAAPAPNTVTSSVVIDVNGQDIGMVGATTPTLAAISSPGTVGIAPTWAGTTPTEAELDALAAEIQAEVNALLAANPEMNKVILLAHMQQLSIEQGLAARLSDVDIIVAGGSNTRLFDENDRVRDGDSDQGDYPQFIENAGGTQTALVNTDGSYKYVGRLVLDFDADGNIIPESYDADVSGAYATDQQGVEDLGAEGLIDPEIQTIVDALEAQIIATEGNVFGVSDVFLNGNRSGDGSASDPDGVRTQETNLGNLSADANLAYATELSGETVLIALKNGGGIRANIGEIVVPAGGTEAERQQNSELLDGDGNVVKPTGGISQTDIQTTLAFNNDLVLMTLTGAEVVALLEHGVGAIPGVSGRFPQVSGVKFAFDPDQPEGDRIQSAGIFDEEDKLVAELVRDGELVDPSMQYRVVTLGFLASPRFDDGGSFTGGGDGYPFPNTNTDPDIGEIGLDAARINLVELEVEGTQTGNATFADDGTEQDALAEYLSDNFDPENGGVAFADADEGPGSDERIQNLAFRDDDVLPGAATETGLLETFDDADGFTTSADFFSDGGFDYFGITDGAGGGDFGGDPAPNAGAANDYTNTDGSYLVGSDLDGEGAVLPISLDFADINVNGLAKIQFTGDFAEALSTSGPDQPDFIRVEASLDGGDFENILEFRSDETFNGLFRVDTDLDGVGDGVALDNEMTTFFADVAGTGSFLDLRLTFQANSGFEDFAVDNIQVREFEEPPVDEPPVAEFKLISEIQGSSDFSGLDGFAQVGVDDLSALAGTLVTIEAIVTADMQDGGATSDLNGFFVQEELADQDDSLFTSEGLFIFDGNMPAVDVNVGDRVQVTGTVSEFFGMTQLSADSVTVIPGEFTVPPAVEVDFTSNGVMLDGGGDFVANLEAYEGMLISIPTELTVTEMFNLDRFGEYRVSEGGRLEQFTQNNAPSTEGFAAHLEDIAARSIVFDDGRSDQNPEALEIIDGNDGVLTADDSFRMGDTITNATGVLNYSFNEFRLHDATGDYSAANPRPDAPVLDGNFKVASLNVLNFFTTLDESGNTTATGLDPRGADSAEEFDRQLTKIVNAITEIDADIFGLVEIENSEDSSALAFLTDAVNEALGSEVYGFINTGVIGGDAIANAVMYKLETANPIGETDILLDASFIDPVDLRPLNRPAVTQSFEHIQSGERITVSVNHLKSKGSLSGDPLDEAQGDGQGNNNLTRTKAAEILATHLATNPTGIDDAETLIVGDLNAYANEDPVTVLKDAGFTDLAKEELGDAAYSFVFDGQIGTLDYILSTDGLLDNVTGVAEWHINADEADAIDYNLDFGRPADLFNGDNAARNSDHDPVVVAFQFDATEPEFILVEGTRGNDRLIGTDANERFESFGGRSDQMTGGLGIDQFVFGDETSNGRRERDIIRDYEVGVDEIILADGAEIASVRESRSGVSIRFEGDGDSLRVYGRDLGFDELTIITEDEFILT